MNLLGIKYFLAYICYMVKGKTDKLYNLVWVVNNVVKETIMYAMPISLVKWKKRTCRNTTHRMGVLKIESNGK